MSDAPARSPRYLGAKYGAVLAVGLLLLGCGDDSSSTSSSDSSTTGTGGSSTGADTETTAGSSGTDTTGAATGSTSGSTGEICEPPTDDISAIGRDCEDNDCPEGYTCLAFQGIIFRESCAILCEEDCGCPAGIECVEMSDKARTWRECLPR